MSTDERVNLINNLGFIPSLEEQLLLPSLLDHNILVVYRENSNLLRMMSLVSLFMLKQKKKQNQKILVILKPNFQNHILNGLKTSSLINYRITALNGSILPNARKKDYQNCSIILTTPKTLKNDLKEENLENYYNFQLIFILSAERCVGSSSIRYITKKLSKSRLIGCTQINNFERLFQVCNVLGLQEVISLQNETGELKVNIHPYYIPYPKEYFFVLDLLDQLRKFEIDRLKYSGLNLTSKVSIRQINAVHERLKREGDTKVMIQTGNLYRIFLLLRIVISQGFGGVIDYFTNLESRLNSKKIDDQLGQKAISMFLNDIKIQKLREYIHLNREIPHPKIQVLFKLISQYSEGILILTHDYYNAKFIQKIFQENGLRVLHVENPISSFNEIDLKRCLLPFTERKVSICIANTVNSYLASYSLIIIAYDVATNTIETLNTLNVEIPRFFLIAKGTNEQNRFFSIQNRNKSEFNPELLNKRLKSQITVNVQKSKQIELRLSPILYESRIPYLLSEKYDIVKSDKTTYPGLITRKKDFILILTSETISSILPEPSDTLNDLKEEYEEIKVLYIPNALKDYSIDVRYTLFNLIGKFNFYSIPIMTLDDVLPVLEILLKD